MYISLRIKILSLLFLLITALAVVFNESAARLIDEKTQETFQDRLLIIVESASSYWEAEKNQLLRHAVLYSESEKILNYSVYGLTNLLLREMQRLVSQMGYLAMLVHLKGGMQLSTEFGIGLHRVPLNERDTFLTLSKIESQLQKDSMFISATVPIQKMGEFIGLLTLKRSIDNARLKKMARNLQADITVAVGGNIIGSSLEGKALQNMTGEIFRRGENPEKVFTTVLDGKTYSAGTVEVGETIDGKVIRAYCVISQEKMRSLVQEARTQNLQLTVIALVIALFLSVLFSEKVLVSRIRQIRDGSNLIAKGDLALQLSESWSDELGDLARSFNSMAVNLKNNYDKLQHYIDTLEKLKNYIENILSSLCTCVITWTIPGIVERVNDAASNELGEFYKPLEGLTLRRFLRPLNSKSRKAFIEALRVLSKSGESSQMFDLEFDLGANKGYKIMQGRLTFLRESNREPYGVVLTLDNITQRKIIEQQLYHADKLSSIGQLAASVAHEIKNPLASIKTLGQLLQEEIGEGDNRREYIDVIVDEVNRLNGVVEQLLKYAKPEGSVFKKTLFADIIKPVLALVHHESTRHNITISAEYEDNLEIYVDAEKIKQVFLNLIFNAVQAMEKGGGIILRASQSPSGPWSVFQISDTGPGMPELMLERIFEPFFTTKQRGTGLGLAIVKKIIDLHGGKIEVRSSTKSGTEFTIFLPQK